MSTATGSGVTVDISNSLKFAAGGQDVATNETRRSDVVPIFVKKNGLAMPRHPGFLPFAHRLCDILEISTFTATQNDATEVFHAGKAPYQSNSGITFEGSFTVEGNELLQVLAMIGVQSNNNSSATAEFDAVAQIGCTYEGLGDLILHAGAKGAAEKANLVRSDLIRNISIDILEGPGWTQGGENSYSIVVKSKETILSAGKGFGWAAFLFYDNGGTITNAAAPDGVITAFAVKDANNAFPTPYAGDLVAQRVFSGATGAQAYLVNLMLDGQAVSLDAVTFDQATSTITFTVAPDNGAILQGYVLVPTGFASWKTGSKYGPGDIVLYDGNYYIMSTAAEFTSTTDPATDVANWTVLTNQTFPMPYFQSTNDQFPLISWKALQRPVN